MEEVGAFGGEEAIEDVADALDKGVNGARWLLPQKRFELGEGELDRVHVRAVGRQVEDLGAAGGDGIADAGDLVGWEIVEHDDIAAPEGRGEHVPDVDPEASPSMAPSSTQGAVSPERRRPATKVMVFQWPKGTLSRQRSPTGDQP